MLNDECSTLQAVIRSFYAVGEKTSGYVVFVCDVKTKEVKAPFSLSLAFCLLRHSTDCDYS